MVNVILRGALLLWAAFFALIGLRGLADPSSYGAMFGLTVEDSAVNTIRADLSAFFLVAAGGAATGALVPRLERALLVPAALFGTALAGRLFGVLSGDLVSVTVVQAMIIEALTLILMLTGFRLLPRGAEVQVGGADDVPGKDA